MSCIEQRSDCVVSYCVNTLPTPLGSRCFRLPSFLPLPSLSSFSSQPFIIRIPPLTRPVSALFNLAPGVCREGRLYLTVPGQVFVPRDLFIKPFQSCDCVTVFKDVSDSFPVHTQIFVSYQITEYNFISRCNFFWNIPLGIE